MLRPRQSIGDASRIILPESQGRRRGVAACSRLRGLLSQGVHVVYLLSSKARELQYKGRNMVYGSHSCRVLVNDTNEEDLRSLLRSPPKRVPTALVPENDRLAYRVQQIFRLFPSFDIENGYVQWWPICEPLDREETLGWLWVIRPDLLPQILGATSDYLLKCVIREYMRPQTPERSQRR